MIRPWRRDWCRRSTRRIAYLDAIIRGVNMDAIRSRDLHIILDPMYGVSQHVAADHSAHRPLRRERHS